MNSLYYREFSHECIIDPCQAVSLGEKNYDTKCKTIFRVECSLLEPPPKRIASCAAHVLMMSTYVSWVYL